MAGIREHGTFGFDGWICTSSGKCLGKCLHAWVTIFRVFLQSLQDHLIYCRRKTRYFPTWRFWHNGLMLDTNLSRGAVKREVPRQPPIDRYAERILITCSAGRSIELFRRHVLDCACRLPSRAVAQNDALREDNNPKIAQQYFTLLANKHIIGFDITMNQILVMSILQRTDRKSTCLNSSHIPLSR